MQYLLTTQKETIMKQQIIEWSAVIVMGIILGAMFAYGA